MSRVLRVEANDRRIPKIGAWSGPNSTPTCSNTGCQFFFMFRGTSIKIYGRTDSLTVGNLHLELDGYPNEIPLNGTALSNGIVPIFRAESIGDGDHQLLGNVTFLTNGTFLMDHFEIENSSRDGFDLLNAGPTAQNVPAEAVIVDNIDPAIIYNRRQQFDWLDYSDGIGDYGRSASYTWTPGASLSYSFDGVAIWYYGHFCLYCGSFNVSIDGSTPQRFNPSSTLELKQQMIWSNTSLGPGRHTVNITSDGIIGVGLYVDFFRILPGAGTSTLSSFTTTVPPIPPTNQDQTNRVPLAVGLALGLLVLVVIALCGVLHINRRRRRRPIDLDAHSVSLYTGPPTGRADQQSSMPQVRKGFPQPARSSDAPIMATVDRAMSSGETVLGPPPSYVTPTYDWRVDTAQ